MKKILCLLICIATVAMSIPNSFAAGQYIGKISQDDAVNVIEMFDIGIDFEELDLNAEATRINLLTWSLNLLNIELDESVSNPVFKDIKPGSTAAAYTNYAKEMGIVSGYEDGTFRANRSITYNEAITMLLTEISCEDYAINMGGYPVGFRNLASSMNLDNGISKANSNEFLTNGDVMLLLVNFLNAPVVTMSTDSGRIAWGISEDETVASRYYNCTLIDGVVDEVKGTSFSGGNTYTDNIISIDGNMYDATFDSYDLIGKRVKAYISEDVCISVIPYKNDVITLNAADIVPEESTLERIYYDTGKERYSYIKIDPLSDFIRNKKGYPRFTLDDLLINSGNITFIDNDNDGETEVIIADEYDVIWVDYAETVSKTIYNIYQSGTAYPSLNLDDDLKFTLTKDGKEVKISSLRKHDIIMVYPAAYEGENEYRLEVVKNTVNGVISKIDYEEKEITVDGTVYRMSQSLMDVKDAEDENYLNLRTGESITLYLDSYGEVAAVDKLDTENYHYAYVRKLVVDEGNPDDIAFRLLTSDEEWKTVKLRDKVRFNGKSESANTLIKSDKISSDGGHTAVSQIIEYKLNADGEICVLNTANAKENMKDNDYETFRKKTVSQVYRSNNKSFDSMYYISEDGVTFVVPGGESAIDETLYAVYKTGYFRDWGTYTVDLYNCDKFGYAEVACVEVSGDNIGGFSANSFIFNKTTTVVEDDEMFEAVNGAIGANCNITIKMAEGVSADKFEKGAIYSLSLNIDSEIYAYSELVSRKDIDAKTLSKMENPTELHNGTRVKGTVVAIDPYEGKILIDDGCVSGSKPVYKSFKIQSTTMLYTIDFTEKKNIISVGRATDIAVGDYVLANTSYSNLSSIITYKD